MSSDEEDVHQCGRCKQLFYSLDQYFQHKKARLCQKGVAEGSRPIKSEGSGKQAKKVQSCPPENTLANGLNGDLQTPTSSQESETPESLTRQDGPFSTISIEMADTLSLQQENRLVVAPAKKRLAARELALKQPVGDTGVGVFQSQGGDVTVEKKGRGLKRRPTAKNMKKAWAENYKDSVEELTTRDILPGSRGEEGNIPAIDVPQIEESLESVVAEDAQPSLKRSRVLKGDLPSLLNDKSLKSNDWTQDLEAQDELDEQANNKDSSVHPKKKRRGRTSKTGGDNSGVTKSSVRLKRNNSPTYVTPDLASKATTQEADLLEWSDGGEEGMPVLKFKKEEKNLGHCENNGDKENVGVTCPTEEVGSDSECAVTVEQAVKRFIFTRGRSKRQAIDDGTDSGKNWQKENQLADEQRVKKVQRRKRGLGYKCIACGFETVYKSEYQRHTRKEHSMSLYSCDRCSAEFKVMAKASKHVEEEGPCKGAQISHTPSNPGSLMLTKQRMESRRTLEERDKLSGLVFQVWFPYDETGLELDVSRELCLGQKGIIALMMRCSECPYVAQSFKQAQTHFQKHWTYIPALCCFCGRCLPSRYRLIQHVSSLIHDHLNEDQLVAIKSEINQSVGTDETKHSNSQMVCPKCSRKFVQSTALAQHLISYHQVMKLEKKFHCGHCSHIYTKQADLLSHLRNQHQGELQACDYMCPVCERGFKVKGHALRHRECLHTPVQQVPYESEPSTLDLDILLSEPSEEQHICFVCLQALAGRSKYLEHVYQHRVWVPHPTRGAKPRDLFETIVDSTDGSTVMKIRVKMELDLNSRLLTEEERSGLAKKVHMIAEKRRRKFKIKGLHPRAGETEMETVTISDCTPQVADAVSVLQSMADNIPKPSCTGNSHFEPCDFMDNTDGVAMETDEKSGCHGQKTIEENMLREPVVTKSPQKIPSHDGVSDNMADSVDEAATVDMDGEDKEVEEKTQRLLCAFCLTLADTMEEMYNHIVHTHSLVATFRCVKSDCRLNFDTVEEYESHSRVHSQRAFICNICNWHMEKASQLQVHKSASHRSLHCLDTGHCCQVCHKTFVSQEALVQHINQDPHHHQCPHCSKVFKSRADLADHEMTHNNTKSLLCDQCGSTFVNKLTLNRHRQVHSKRNHHCKLCPLAFNKREHLRRHMSTIHSSEKPHQCNYPGCEKRFKRKDKLQEHLKKHSPDKPYVCGLCGRRYRYREGLRYHEKTHNSEGHYQCSKCHVHFNRPSMLQQHLHQQHNIVTSKRLLYPCELCNMAFQRPERRSRHMERAHNITVDWPLRCNLCGRGFPGEKSFETHMKERHANKGKKRTNKVEKFMETVEEGVDGAVIAETGQKAWDVNDNRASYVEKSAEEATGIQYHTEDMVQQAINQTIHLDGYSAEYNPQVVQVVKADQSGTERHTDQQLQWYTQPTVQPVSVGDLTMQGMVPSNLATFQMENQYPVSLVQGNQNTGSGIIQLGQPVLQLNTSQFLSTQGAVSQATNTFMAVGDAQLGFQIDQSSQVTSEQASVNIVQDLGPKDQWTQGTKTSTRTKAQQTSKKSKTRSKKTLQKAMKSQEIPEVKIQYEGKDMSHSQLLLQLQQQALAHQQQEELRASQQDMMDSQQEVIFQPSTEGTHKVIQAEGTTTAQKSAFETNLTLFPNINIQVQDPNQSVTTATNTVLTASQSVASCNTATLPKELTELLMKSIVSQMHKNQSPSMQTAANRNVNLVQSTNLTGAAQADNGQLKMTVRDLQRQEDKAPSTVENTSQLQQLLQGPLFKSNFVQPQPNSLGESRGVQQMSQPEQPLVSGDQLEDSGQQMNDSQENSMRLPHQTQVVHWQGDRSLKQQMELPGISQTNLNAIGCTFTPQVLNNQASSQLVQNFLPSIVIPVSTQTPSSETIKNQQVAGMESMQNKVPPEGGGTGVTPSLLYQQLVGGQQQQQSAQDTVQMGGDSASQPTFVLNNPALTGPQTYVLATPSVMSSTPAQPTYLLTTATGGINPTPVTQAQLIFTQRPASDTSDQMQQTYGVIEPFTNMKTESEGKSQLMTL